MGALQAERQLLEAFLDRPLCDIDPGLDEHSESTVRRLLAREHGSDSDGDAVFNSVI